MSFFLSGGLGEHNPSKKRGSLYLLLDRIRRLGFGKFKTLDCFSAFFLIYPTAPLAKPQVPLHQHLELALKLALFTLSILSIHLDQLIIYIIENDSSMCMFLFMYFFRAQYFITHNSIIWWNNILFSGDECVTSPEASNPIPFLNSTYNTNSIQVQFLTVLRAIIYNLSPRKS